VVLFLDLSARIAVVTVGLREILNAVQNARLLWRQGVKRFFKIKDGAMVGQDMHYAFWKSVGTDPVFEGEEKITGTKWRLSALGYGKKNDYGNGPLYVNENDLIEVVDSGTGGWYVKGLCNQEQEPYYVHTDIAVITNEEWKNVLERLERLEQRVRHDPNRRYGQSSK
jgi:hypothetical protein